MRTLARVVGTALAALLLVGCGLDWIPYSQDDPPPRPRPTPRSPEPVPRPVPAPATPTTQDGGYTGRVAKGAGCVTLDDDTLEFLEAKGAVGGAVTYPRGAMVRSSGDWWAIAIATQVNPNGEGRTRDNVPAVVYFVSNLPWRGDNELDREVTFPVASAPAGGKAMKKADDCLAKLPVPKPTPSPGSPETYSGKLAKGATCAPVPPGMLATLEEVGQVGGAVTYPRGAMVRANGRWWTVAVATQVNPNGAGLSEENVAATALFVTNDPSYKESSPDRIVYFPLKPATRDAAAAKALKCLGAG
ncbi:MAG: hypothetical protein AAGC63_06875 [Propionicimonas sp.]|nr:hypothetical protein [Propionicimonas sp.]